MTVQLPYSPLPGADQPGSAAEAAQANFDTLAMAVSPPTGPTGFLPGDIKATARATPDTGWLLCDGSSVLRIDYPDLFSALGGASSPYGLPDGTHFNLPDLRGRVPVGEDGAAGRLGSNDARGQSGGVERVGLAASELPAHAHDFNGGALLSTSGAFANYNTGPSAAGTATQTGTGIGLSGNSHQNMQPYQVVNYFIKT